MAEERRPRWTEAGSDAPPLLQELIKREQADVPTDAQLQELARRIAGGLAGGAPPMPASGFGGVPGRIAMGLGAALLAGAALWAGSIVGSESGRAERRLPELTTVAQAVRAEVPAPEPRAEPAPAVQAPLAVANDAKPVAVRAKLPAKRVAPAAPNVQGSPMDELELVRKARVSLAGNPERALEVVAQHEAGFRNGTFVEEREAIAVEALLKAGREAAARRRGEAFLKRFPGSAYRRRISGLLAGQ